MSFQRPDQSGIVIKFDNRQMLLYNMAAISEVVDFQLYSVRFVRYLFVFSRVIYPQFYSIWVREVEASRVPSFCHVIFQTKGAT